MLDGHFVMAMESEVRLHHPLHHRAAHSPNELFVGVLQLPCHSASWPAIQKVNTDTASRCEIGCTSAGLPTQFSACEHMILGIFVPSCLPLPANATVRSF